MKELLETKQVPVLRFNEKQSDEKLEDSIDEILEYVRGNLTRTAVLGWGDVRVEYEAPHDKDQW
jgi:hypothetical protein